MRVGLFGTGAYGLAISSILTHNEHEVIMWTRFEEEKRLLEEKHGNEKLLPGFTLDERVTITNSIEKCIINKDLLIIAIPAPFVTELCEDMKPYINGQHILIATKGIEQKTGLFMSEIVENYLNTKNIAVISGPSFAVDIITKNPIGLSIASKSTETLLLARKALQNNYIRLEESEDIIGIEICGSIKNVIAIASGILDGMEANDSTKAMLITEAVKDMESILEVFGCDRDTVDSYSGIGDLLLTCTSEKSRNYSLGKLIGTSTNPDEIKDYIKNNTIEGYYTLESIYDLLKNKNIAIPIIDLIYEIVIKEKDPKLLLTFLVYKI